MIPAYPVDPPLSRQDKPQLSYHVSCRLRIADEVSNSLGVNRSAPIRFFPQDVETVQGAFPITQHSIIIRIIPLCPSVLIPQYGYAKDLPSTCVVTGRIPAEDPSPSGVTRLLFRDHIRLSVILLGSIGRRCLTYQLARRRGGGD